jgi:hypothetical protein
MTPSQAAPPWTTPQILKTGLAGIWFSSVLLMLAAIMGARSHRHAIQVVGKDAAPSIFAAQQIRAALARMDANAATELLGGKDAAAAKVAFEQRRTEAVSAIVAAAENITYGDKERKPIFTLALGLGTYTAAIQTARDRREAGDKSFLAAWREAAGFMDSTLLPAAAALNQANLDALEETYLAQATSSTRVLALLVLPALALGAVLFFLQIFLLRRMHRILNPLLFLATLTAFVFVVYSGQRFAAANRDLKVAKEDAFDSIHTLWQARAMGYSASGDQSRALLDPAQRAVYDRDFAAKTSTIADDYLAKELKNITFTGEREKAEHTVAAFTEYRAAKSEAAFAQFDEALRETLRVNQDAFAGAVSSGFRELDGFDVISPVMAFIISLLAWLGLRPRIHEYSA